MRYQIPYTTKISLDKVHTKLWLGYHIDPGYLKTLYEVEKYPFHLLKVNTPFLSLVNQYSILVSFQ